MALVKDIYFIVNTPTAKLSSYMYIKGEQKYVCKSTLNKNYA